MSANKANQAISIAGAVCQVAGPAAGQVQDLEKIVNTKIITT